MSAAASAYRWRIACGFCAVVTFTVIAGYYVPSLREAAQLRREREALEAANAASNAALERLQLELRQQQAENESLRQGLASPRDQGADVRARIEKLERLLSAQFARLAQAEVLLVSSAAERVSVAIAVPALFSARDHLTSNGRELLCQLSKAIMSEYGGQIRITGYYGKPRLDPEDARRGTPWHLAAARAASAADALERECKAPAERFLVVSYGPRAAGPLGENVALEFIFRPEDGVGTAE